MFIYSVRSTTLKFCLTIFLGVALVCTLVTVLPKGTEASQPSKEALSYHYDGIENYEDMGNFLKQFGWQIEKAPVSDEKVTIPETFDRVYAEYNRLQRSQGLDLSEFAGKKVEKVVFRVTNFEKPGENGEGETLSSVYATLLVYRNHIIGGDLSSRSPEKFVTGFEYEKD